MSVLLVEVLADSLPCQLPPSRPFDKELLVLSESSYLPAHLRGEYVAVSDCLEFIRSPHTKLVIRTSSELFRGIIAGTLYANYKLTISSDRPDLYLRVLPSAQIYSSQPTAPEKPMAPISPETPMPPVAPRDGSVSTELVSEETFQKLCNIYLNNVVSSQRVRAATLAGAKEQILAVLDGMFVKSVPYVKNKDKVAQLLLEAMVRGNFLRVEGLNIVYNPQQLFNKPIHYRLSIPPVSEPVTKKPKSLKILKTDPLYVKSCNIYLNSYLTSQRLRSTNVDQAKSALEKIVRENHAPYPMVLDLTEAIFNSFQASGYYSVRANQVTYNLAKCKCKSLDGSSVPSVPSTPYLPQSTPSQEAPQVETSSLPKDLQTHISEIVLLVMSRADSLGTMAQIIKTIQQCILEYEVKHQVVFALDEVETTVQTVLEFLADNGYCSQDYPH
jgi:hypothetical protein